MEQVLIAAVVVQKLVERLKVQFPVLKGSLVSLVSYAFGGLFAFGFDQRFDLIGSAEPWVQRSFAALAIGAGAGFLADILGRSDH
jgi:hypothetical protein